MNGMRVAYEKSSVSPTCHRRKESETAKCIKIDFDGNYCLRVSLLDLDRRIVSPPIKSYTKNFPSRFLESVANFIMLVFSSVSPLTHQQVLFVFKPYQPFLIQKFLEDKNFLSGGSWQLLYAHSCHHRLRLARQLWFTTEMHQHTHRHTDTDVKKCINKW